MSPPSRQSPVVSLLAAFEGRALDSVRWARVKELFLAALELPDASRRGYLERESAGDPSLLDEVESLLRSDAAASGCFEIQAGLLLASSTDSGDAPDPVLPMGARLGAYELTGFIAAGGMGQVYRARHTVLGREVAIKMVRGMGVDPAASRRLIREARHAGRLKHPNICTVHEVGEANDLRFIVMELVDGRSLRELIREGVPPIGRTLDIGTQIATALEHAHDRGIVHRDLKSSNVMIDSMGNAIVLDFGLATSVWTPDGISQPDMLTDPCMMAGTLSHMAPELLRGAAADHRSDIWSLGVLLYEMTSGRLPFTGRTPFATSSAILDRPPTPLPREVAPALRHLVARCLEKDPSLRYRSARAVADALIAAARPSRWPMLGELRHSLRSRWFIGGAVLLLGMLGATDVNERRVHAIPPNMTTRMVVAVLPFVSATGGRSDDVFADGLTEAVSDEIGWASDVRVLARASTERAAAAAPTAVGAGAALGADIVVQGHVHRSGSIVSATVRVVRPFTGATVWSRRYVSERRDMLVLEADIVRGLTDAGVLIRRAGALERLTAVRAVNPDAYEEYLKGRYAWNHRTPRSLASAIEHFNQAIRLDSTYAPAHAALADCYNLLGSVMVGSGSPEQYRPRAETEAIRALQIDPSLAEAHAALGYVWHYQWRWLDAERELQRALALKPTAPLPHIWYANLLMSRGRMREATDHVLLARELDPFSLIVNTNVGWVLDRAGRHDDAIAQFERTLALDSSYVHARWRLADALSGAGRDRDALRESERVVAMTDSAPPMMAQLAKMEARAGLAERARKHLRRLLARRATEYVPPASIASVYAALGDRDRALSWLERAFAERSNAIAYLAGEPYDESLKQEPRYVQLLVRAGLR